MTDVIGPGSLKLITVCSPERSVRDTLYETLRAHIDKNDVRHLHAETFLIYTDADPAAIRDWLASILAENDSVFVVEFERWSGHGPAVDGRWLLRRGH